MTDLSVNYAYLLTLLLGWPTSWFGFFHNISGKSPNELLWSTQYFKSHWNKDSGRTCPQSSSSSCNTKKSILDATADSPPLHCSLTSNPTAHPWAPRTSDLWKRQPIPMWAWPPWLGDLELGLNFCPKVQPQLDALTQWTTCTNTGALGEISPQDSSFGFILSVPECLGGKHLTSSIPEVLVLHHLEINAQKPGLPTTTSSLEKKKKTLPGYIAKRFHSE